MLDSLITSKTRIKLLLKFFLNSNNKSYLRNLATEFGESTNAIRLELNRLEDADLLTTSAEGNKKLYQANTTHPFFSDINRILFKYVGIDQIIASILDRLGNLIKAYLVGDFAHGKASKIIDIILVGKELDLIYLAKLVSKAETEMKVKIRYITIAPEEMESYSNDLEGGLLIWSS